MAVSGQPISVCVHNAIRSKKNTQCYRPVSDLEIRVRCLRTTRNWFQETGLVGFWRVHVFGQYIWAFILLLAKLHLFCCMSKQDSTRTSGCLDIPCDNSCGMCSPRTAQKVKPFIWQWNPSMHAFSCAQWSPFRYTEFLLSPFLPSCVQNYLSISLAQILANTRRRITRGFIRDRIIILMPHLHKAIIVINNNKNAWAF